MAGVDITKTIEKISSADVLAVKNELIGLYNMEVYERNLYFQELRKFDGEIFETVKWLSMQEEGHVSVLEQVLTRGNVPVNEEKKANVKLSTDGIEIIKMNINNENTAVKNYTNTISKTNGPLKTVLEYIMGEELVHIERLKKYVKQ
jgi:hypothetical protein